MIRVELFGPPGVGKTTVAQACGAPSVQPFVGDLPEPYAKLEAVARETHTGPLARFLDGTLLYIRRAAALSVKEGPPVVVDEMLAQRAALMCVHGTREAAERFVEAMPVDDAEFVSLVARGPSDIVARGAARERPGVGFDQAKAYMDACRFVGKHLCKCSATSWDVDADQVVQEIARDVLDLAKAAA